MKECFNFRLKVNEKLIPADEEEEEKVEEIFEQVKAKNVVKE